MDIHTSEDTRVQAGAHSETGCLSLSCGRVHKVQFFTRLEADSFARCDAHFGPSPGISPNARLAWLHGEHAKPAQFDPIARDQRLLHAVEDCVHSVFRFGSRKSGPLHDPLDKVLFNQVGPPLSRNLDRSMFEVAHCPASVMLGTNPPIVNAPRLP